MWKNGKRSVKISQKRKIDFLKTSHILLSGGQIWNKKLYEYYIHIKLLIHTTQLDDL